MEDPIQPPADPAAPSDSSAGDAGGSPSPEPEAAAAPPSFEPLAPGVPRLATPRGATRSTRDPSRHHPSFLFLAIVSIVTLAADIGTKLWAEKRLEVSPPFTPLWPNHLTFTLARNHGGAWGLLQGANENIRRPFFLLVSVAAIAFIVTLYRRLQRKQRALKWGLPLVLGGALGNVFDRIRYGWVIDFIDYKAEWVKKMNTVFHGSPTDHWPTFNVADVAICVGVALMAIDMFTAKRGRAHPVTGETLPPPPRHESESELAPAHGDSKG